jgi:DNA-binding NarL/FixJ family response regulator
VNRRPTAEIRKHHEKEATAMLIVEDQDYMRQSLRAFLQSVFPDKNVRVAADGKSAMALCREHHPKLVLMDIVLSDANGIELTAKIKAMMPDTAVIIVSSHSGSAYSERAKAAGAFACIAKESVYEDLLPAVNAALAAAKPGPGRSQPQ